MAHCAVFISQKKTADAKKLQERQKLMNGRALDQYNKDE